MDQVLCLVLKTEAMDQCWNYLGKEAKKFLLEKEYVNSSKTTMKLIFLDSARKTELELASENAVENFCQPSREIENLSTC